ncbi:MAG TPA: monofunctional biosynthetic peptidoglycan transglycosylase [Terriglobia bacterium]|nr:monofunctional biosynthetic peptidoglycan transglycosylase [Terriglobia bacterium]
MPLKKLILAFFGLLLVVIAVTCLTLPDVSDLKTNNPSSTALMRQRELEARAAGKRPRKTQIWVRYDTISNRLKSAVLIGEDDAFFQHQGYDLEQIKESFIKNWEKKGLVRGGSTITQQLAKNLYLSTSKNPLRKLMEFLIARRLEEELTKRRIFEIYLNVIEWGDGIYGVEAASQIYFKKSSSALTTGQALQLAAMIPNPRKMSPSHITRRLTYRANLILSRMLEYRHISEKDYHEALDELDQSAHLAASNGRK